jgi:hypothetical protein
MYLPVQFTSSTCCDTRYEDEASTTQQQKIISSVHPPTFGMSVHVALDVILISIQFLIISLVFSCHFVEISMPVASYTVLDDALICQSTSIYEFDNLITSCSRNNESYPAEESTYSYFTFDSGSNNTTDLSDFV